MISVNIVSTKKSNEVIKKEMKTIIDEFSQFDKKLNLKSKELVLSMKNIINTQIEDSVETQEKLRNFIEDGMTRISNELKIDIKNYISTHMTQISNDVSKEIENIKSYFNDRFIQISNEQSKGLENNINKYINDRLVKISNDQNSKDNQNLETTSNILEKIRRMELWLKGGEINK